MKLIYKTVLTIILCFFSVVGFSQTEKFQKAKLKNSIVFKGNITEVWSYLSDLGNLQNLVPSTINQSVVKGVGVGSTVTLTLQNKGRIVEKVTELNDKKYYISYTMIETPLPVRNYLASFNVIELPDKHLKVTFNASFSVQEINRKMRIEVFNKLQLELLENLKKIKSEK